MEQVDEPAKSLGDMRYEPVGPTADHDIRRLIARYGTAEVRAALKRQGKVRRGRKLEPDWSDLSPVLEDDARIWLEGGDPFTARSNYAIAKEFADRKPGQSHPATMKRIERKLAQKRVLYTLYAAEQIGAEGYPFEAFLRTLEALAKLQPEFPWPSMRDHALRDIKTYTRKVGHEPAPSLTMREVEEVSRNALLKPPSKTETGVIGGLLDTYLRNQSTP